MRDWKTVRLEEYLTFRNGKKSPEREPSGCFPVYGSNGIIGFCSMNNTSANTITIGRVGAYCGSVYFSSVPSWVTDNAIIAEPYSPEEARFWYYVLSWLNLNTYTHGSAQPLINQTILRNITIKIPCKEKRLAIAEVLSSLDDQIELLSKQNEALEKLVLAHHSILCATDKMVDVRVSDIAHKSTKSISPAKLVDETYSVYSIPAFDNGKNPETFSASQIKSTKYIICEFDVLISKLNPSKSRIWLIDDLMPNGIASTEYVLLRAKNHAESKWLYCSLKNETVTQILGHSSSGTSGSHQRVRPAMILDLSIRWPDEDQLHRFEKFSTPLFEKQRLNRRQIQQLRRTRDALLPQLMSGALRVGDTKRVIAEEVSHA